MTTFVGEDRRARRDMRPDRAALLGAAVVVAASFAVPTHGAADAGAALDTATALAAVAVFVLCRARWRLFGQTAPLWAGAAALVAGAAAAGGVRAAGPSVVRAGLLAGLALLGAGAWAPAVDTRVRPVRLLAVGAVAALAASVLASAAAVVVACAGVAAVTIWRKAYGWASVLVIAFALSQVVDGLRAQAVFAAGFSAAVVCCAIELGRAYVDQRSRLFHSEVSLQAAAVDERLQEASRSTRRHDVRNAVVAVEGAALILESHVDRLSPEDRAALTKVLSSGVERLQRLLTDEAAGAATVDLAALAAEVAAERGELVIKVDVPDGLVASGSPGHSAEVLRILFDNAQRRAPGQPVEVHGRRDGDWMVLQVRDRGAPVGREERRSRADADMGFLVAGRLMRDQGGDVWVESHPEGGAFSLCLPCVSSS